MAPSIIQVKPSRKEKPQPKVTAITLTIRKKKGSGHYISSIPLQKLINLEQHHRKANTTRTWKLSQDQTKLLLI